MSGPRLIDDRGHAVELRLASHLVGELRRVSGGGTPLLRALRRALLGKVLFPSCVCLVVLGLITLSTLAVGPAIVLIVVFSPVLACLLLLGLTGAVRVGEAAHEWAEPFTGDCLRAGRCPCCAYDLGRLRPDAEGLVTCPECGASWVPATGEADAPVVLHGLGSEEARGAASDDEPLDRAVRSTNGASTGG